MTDEAQSVGHVRPSRGKETAVRANDAGLADAAGSKKSAYVHIPFCARRCPYCDFAIVDESVVSLADHDRYTSAVIAEITMESAFGELDAVNFGGGTPSRLSPHQLGSIVDALGTQFGFAPGCEISLEVNPEDWTEAMAVGLTDAGFNRVSIGAQTFDTEILGVLGRVHDVALPAAVVESAKTAGFSSVSLDLIYGHPSESALSWEATVEAALELPIDHISTYALTVEPGTALSREVHAGASAPDDDVQADRYEYFCERSAKLGFDRYEVSNHARPGHACVYNLATWSHAEYLGFGLGAHDHRWGIRSRNHRRLDRFYGDIDAGERPRLGTEVLSQAEQERDAFMLGIRRAAGFPLNTIAARFLASEPGARLVTAGLLRVAAGRVIVTQPMLTDAIARDALSVSLDDC